MSNLAHLAIDRLFERRASERMRLTLPAHLETLEFSTPVLMLDLGPYGARIVLPCKPRLLNGQLRWLKFEALGEVIWSADYICGMKFSRPLSTLKLRRTSEAVPAAAVENAADEMAMIKTWIEEHS